MNSSKSPTNKARSWALDRELARHRFRDARDSTFRNELIEIGQAQGGPGLGDDDAISIATRTTCFCGLHGDFYPRCTFESPRHLGDVFLNALATGTKSAAFFAAASHSLLQTYPEVDFDYAIAFGFGAGGCLLGVELELDLPPTLFGVEVDSISSRVARAMFPTLTSVQTIEELPEMKGTLLVTSGLVFNVVNQATAAKWAEWLSSCSNDIFWMDLAGPGFKNNYPGWKMESLGYKKSVFHFERRDAGSRSDSEYVSTGIRWTR